MDEKDEQVGRAIRDLFTRHSAVLIRRNDAGRYVVMAYGETVQMGEATEIGVALDEAKAQRAVPR